MDRRSIIQATYLKSTVDEESRCSEEDCVCDEINVSRGRQLFQKNDWLQLISISLLAFVFAFLLAIIKMNAMSENMRFNKRATIVSCYLNDPVKEKYRTDRVPKDNGSCPHQWRASTCLCMNDSKRKKTNTMVT